MKRTISLLAFLVVFALPALASAYEIYYNDPPESMWGDSFAVGRDQWLAKRIVLDDPVQVGSIEVYFDSFNFSDRYFFNLYDMATPSYGPGGYYFPEPFRTINFNTIGSGEGWFGVTGLNLALDSGYLWIEVGAWDGNGAIPAGGAGYAYATMLQWDANGDPIPAVDIDVYQSYRNEQDMGLRIYSPTGNPTATPEPSTLVLAALGLAGAALMRRKLKK